MAREAAACPSVAVELVVILDGDDAQTERTLRAKGVGVLVKSPAGPSKGAVLVFATEALGERLDAADFVMVFDADMRLPEGWLRGLRLPAGTRAFQLPVRPSGVPPRGAARVEALSLAVATRVEDSVRDAMGLPVRLRGKAMGFAPDAWRLGPARAARTLAEDSEATLRLQAEGIRIRALAGPESFDEPAESAAALAAPRARWLAGHLKLLVTGVPDFARLFARSPRAALVLAGDLWLRPRALVLSFLALIFVVSLALHGPWSAASLAISGLGLAAELAYTGRARLRIGTPEEVPPVTPRDLLGALGVWLHALARAATAPGRWHRARPEAGGSSE